MGIFIVKFFTALGIAVIVAILLALPTMLLWNWLMPTIFGLIKIGLGQAFGMNLLAGIFFQRGSSDSK